MKKYKAIEYLERKGKIRTAEIESDEYIEFTKEEKKFYTNKEKKEIEKVMKEGKIYGDPLVVLNE